jgi:hypothetical protein
MLVEGETNEDEQGWREFLSQAGILVMQERCDCYSRSARSRHMLVAFGHVFVETTPARPTTIQKLGLLHHERDIPRFERRIWISVPLVKMTSQQKKDKSPGTESIDRFSASPQEDKRSLAITALTPIELSDYNAVCRCVAETNIIDAGDSIVVAV